MKGYKHKINHASLKEGLRTTYTVFTGDLPVGVYHSREEARSRKRQLEKSNIPLLTQPYIIQSQQFNRYIR